MYYTHYSRRGNNILIRYKKPNDPNTYSKVVDFYKPSLFTLSQDEADWKSIYGQPLKKVEFNSIKAAKDFANQYKDVPTMGLNGNSNYENQFIIELFDGKQPEYEDKNIRVGYLDIEVHSPDEFPKPNEAKHPINAVTVYDSVTKTFYAFGLEYEGCGSFSLDKLDDETKAKIEHLKFEYFAFNTEMDLIRNLLQHISDHGYDCVTGWNSEGFDIPYTINRSYKILGQAQTKKLLSPFNMIDRREFINSYGQETETYDIIGLPHLDYLQMYKKHTFVTRESYKLDFIAQEELGENKLEHSEEKSLATLYENNYPKFIAYNIRDVDLIVRLDEKLGLFGLTYAIMYYTLSNFEDTMGTVKIWEQLIAKFLYTKGKVPPFKRQKVTEERDFEGAYVKEPIKGFHDWIVSFDLNSLYPHIEQQWNIGPETIVKDLPDELQELRDTISFDDILERKKEVTEVLARHNVTMAANKEFYKLDKMSFFSEIKRELYAERKAYKKQMLAAEQKKVNAQSKEDKLKYEFEEAKYDNLQMGLKILLNGGYGALAQKSFLYYMVENAEAITLSGQLVNKWTSSKINKFLQSLFKTDKQLWAYSDTDSCYLTIKDFVDTLTIKDQQKLVDTIDQFCCEVISPKIKEVCQELCEYLNCYEQRMFWGREVIADKAIWIGKKKYVMSVLDSEGTRYKEPKVKIMGMESVKSSTPAWSRKFLKDIYIIGLYKTESDMLDYLDHIREVFDNMAPSDIAIPSGINGIMKYLGENGQYIKGTPKHVKAAITHNNMIEKLGLKKIQKIQDGDRIKYVELVDPNPSGQETVAFSDYLPEEFGLESYIDRDAIFERSFMKPLRIFIEPIGWKEEKSVDLFSF